MSPSYGTEGTKNTEFCSQHAKAGMVNVKSKQCGRRGCNLTPSYGLEGAKAEFCSQHAREGMVNVKGRRCEHQGCTKDPTHGVEGTMKAELCSQHTKEGMVDVIRFRRTASKVPRRESCKTRQAGHGVDDVEVDPQRWWRQRKRWASAWAWRCQGGCPRPPIGDDETSSTDRRHSSCLCRYQERGRT